MYVLNHREPAFASTPVQAVLESARLKLNKTLDRYEFVAETTEIIELPDTDERSVRDASYDYQREHNWRARVHFARRIENGWEFALAISGD